MIQDIKLAAEAVGITAVITNSTEKIETQLNRITRIEDLPLMLVSWDMVSSLEFDENGFLLNPKTDVVMLLLDKAEDTRKESAEAKASEIALLFQSFIQNLYSQLSQYQKVQGEDILTGVSYTLVPKHGLGKHSGILGRFTASGQINNEC